MTRRVWVFTGAGRCAAATAYVVGETEAAARTRLLRDDASPHFVIGSVEPLRVLGVPATEREEDGDG